MFLDCVLSVENIEQMKDFFVFVEKFLIRIDQKMLMACSIFDVALLSNFCSLMTDSVTIEVRLPRE